MKKINLFANICIVLILIFLFMVACYLFFHGELNRNRSIIGIFFIISFVLFSFALRFPIEWKINLLMVCGSFGISIYAIEFYLYFFKPVANNTPSAIANIAKTFGVNNYDTRTKIQVLQDFRKNGIDAYPTVHPDMLFTTDEILWNNPNLFPLASISNKFSVLCNECGHYISYNTDEHGFNNNKGLYRTGTQIALIGDSFTQGSCVSREDNIAGNLIKHSLNVLNFGVGGCGPLQEYAIFNEYVTFVQPKIVLWIFCEHNDMDDLLNELSIPALKKYYTDNDFTQNLYVKQDAIDSSLKNYVNKQLKQYKTPGINFVSLLKLWEIRSRMNCLNNKNPVEKEISNEQEKVFAKILSFAKGKIAAWGGALLFCLSAWLLWLYSKVE